MSVTIRPYRHGGWEVDIVWRTPDGRLHRDRKRVGVKSKAAAREWGVARERDLLVRGPTGKCKEVPTFNAFWPRFLEGYARANRQKPSGVAAKETIGRVHLQPPFGTKRRTTCVGASPEFVAMALIRSQVPLREDAAGRGLEISDAVAPVHAALRDRSRRGLPSSPSSSA